jgi:hypothetical protein
MIPNHHLIWRKSSFSGPQQNCVELATTADAVHVRDSKHPERGHLTFAPAEVGALVAAARAGELDHLIG